MPAVSDAIRVFSLFAREPASVRDALARHARVLARRAGRTVVAQGAVADAVYGVIAGRLRVSWQHSDGRRSTLSVLGAGDIFGELGVLNALSRAAQVEALDDVVVLRVPADDFLGALRSSASLGLALSRALAERVRRLGEQQVQLTALEASQRVAYRLLFLAERFGRADGAGVTIDAPLTQEDLAELASLSRQHVNRVLRTLTREGIVARKGRRLIVRDVAALRAVAVDVSSAKRA